MNTDTTSPLLPKRPRLVIRVGRQSLSFSALDNHHEGQILFQPYTVRSGISMAANLREAFRTLDLLSGGWQRALIVVDTPVLMVPTDEFNEDQARSLYEYTYTDVQNDLVMSTVVYELNAVALYSVNKDLKLVIDDHFSDVKFMHANIPVWRHLHRRNASGPHRKLFGYFHDRRLDVFAFQQNRFRFTNCFDVTHAKDAVYFLLYVWKQLALDQRRDELHLAGVIPEQEETLGSLRKYLRNAYVINPAGDFNRAPITQVKGLPYDLMVLFIKGA